MCNASYDYLTDITSVAFYKCKCCVKTASVCIEKKPTNTSFEIPSSVFLQRKYDNKTNGFARMCDRKYSVSQIWYSSFYPVM